MENVGDPVPLQVVSLDQGNDAIFYLDPTLKELSFLKKDVMLSDTAISVEKRLESTLPEIQLNIPVEFSDHSGDEEAAMKYYYDQVESAKESLKAKKKSYKESRQR